MFAMTTRFTMSADTDWEQFRRLAVRRAFESYRTIPGLHAKVFVFSPERGECGGDYVWETQDDAEAFLRSEIWRKTVALFGEPRVERWEVSAYVEDGDLVHPPDYDVRTAAPRDEGAPGPGALDDRA